MANWLLTSIPSLFNGERIVSSRDDEVATKFLHAKELSWTLTSHYIQTLTQNKVENLNIKWKP